MVSMSREKEKIVRVPNIDKIYQWFIKLKKICITHNSFFFQCSLSAKMALVSLLLSYRNFIQIILTKYVFLYVSSNSTFICRLTC